MSPWLFFTILYTLVAVQEVKVVESVVAPNHFLGSCLTDDWVTSMEKSLKVNRNDRDDKGRLQNPFLQAARKHALQSINDPRTTKADTFGSCMDKKTTIVHGVGAVVDKSTGAVLDQGVTNGSLVVELSGWTTHSLTTLVFSIIAQEVVGVPVSFLGASSYATFDRMSAEKAGACTPTHTNLEVWRGEIIRTAETYAAGDIGYFGRSGLYTTKDFVANMTNKSLHSNPTFPDFWKGYNYNEEIIQSVPVSSLRNNTNFFPPKWAACSDNTIGCLNHCSRTAACTEREQAGGECMVVAMMYFDYDRAYLQAVMDNLGIPTYFCFIGYSGVQNFAVESYQQKRPVLFYHYEPDPFHIDNPGVFERVFLPRSLPERVQLNSFLFGEHGYGTKTDNPIDVDFPSTKLMKYAANIVSQSPVGSFLSKFGMSELNLNEVMRIYHTSSSDSSLEDPVFDAACKWIRGNYAVWTSWLDRLPMCEIGSHVKYTMTGCESSSNDAEGYRTIVFEWKTPNPDNASEPYDCDGGLQQLPKPLKTSRSCDWINSETSTWQSWITTKPKCDSSFYKYNITTCDKKAKRTVNYWWLLPNPDDLSLSLECEGGDGLPGDVRIDCDYMPTDSPGFVVIMVIDLILIGLLVAAIGFIIRYRDQPIVKRSQWEFLILVIVGGIIICVAALLYAGEPSTLLCGARPVSTALGFTTIFGALFVKSLRVYRVFMKSAFKKATVSALLMLKVFIVLVSVDVIILVVWFSVDFPHPSIESAQAQEFRGLVDHIACRSNSLIFTALLVFWKTIVLFMGLYSSFLIRNVSSDFQESIWMFASSVMVLVSCLVVLPLAYLVDMPPAIFYVFLACTLLVCTTLVMAFMILPKIHRLNAAASAHSSGVSNKVTDTSTRDPSSKYASMEIKKRASTVEPASSDGTESSSHPLAHK